jgi:hypothetical protein
VTGHETHRITKGERRLLIISTLFVLGVVGLSWWWITIDTNPVVAIPPYPAAPVPNAYDSYVAACSAISMGKNPAAAAVSDAKEYPKYSLSEKEALVATNAGAIATLRAGFGDDYREPNNRSFHALFPAFGSYRNMARFLAFSAHVRAEKGDYTASLRLALDGMELGQAGQHETVLIGCLVGIALQSIGRTPAWDILPQLSEQDAAAGARRVASIMARQPADFASVLTEEKYTGQSGLLEIFHQPRTKWATYIVDTPTYWAPLFIINKREAMTQYTAYCDAHIARARLPRSKRGALPPEPKNFLASFLIPVTNKAELKSDICLCENRLLMVALAVRAYQAKHGASPTTLADLVPTYMNAIPDDPFGSGPLLYKRTGSSYVLYSVGPNGVDDGGTPITGKAIEETSAGDIVAGVNRY